MMPDRSARPGSALLLRYARGIVLGRLLDDLPEERRYDARMVAKALAVVAREIAAGDAPIGAERDRLTGLFGEPSSDAETAAETVERLGWLLAAEIRGGKRDGDVRTHETLRRGAVARLREVDPKTLPADMADGKVGS